MTAKKDVWDAALYDNQHGFVSNYGMDLVSLLQPKKGERILDIGCGTGNLANTLHEVGADIVGIDFSTNMIAQAKQKYPHIAFHVADATKLTYEQEFDAIFSNATLHWIKQPEAAIASMYRALKQGGRIVMEFGGAGNVQTITDSLIAHIKRAGIPFTDEQFPWYFPTIAEYTTLLEKAGFHVSDAAHFSRPTKLAGEEGLVNWLEMFSPTIFDGVADAVKYDIFQQVVQDVREKLYSEDTWYADYKRLRILAIK